ncbi:protein RGF1 INDUCIBLE TRANSCRIPTION FACTOR 1-like [Tasmannia lanceolata]|uniref:protein RGF1 INDUCIBLE TRANSCRIPTION FACTOR 1-like n=1 Tax=Tasmannia lanceolata TaxID=3420 RepID=UPI004063BE50
MEDSMLVPPWLESMLSAAYFSSCRNHADSTRSECNMFCLDCAGDALCYYCRSSRHKDHHVIQIRRSSYHDVVRVAEIQNVLDITGVQTYVINSARVLFLNERPQPKTGKGVSHLCEICGRSLLDPFRFCSLGCKLLGIKRNGDACFVLESKVDGMQGLERREEGISESVSRDEEELREVIQHDIYHPPPNQRRRKGIPHRAPFAS